MSLLEATTTSPCSPVGQPFVAEVDRVWSPNRAISARGNLPTLEAVRRGCGYNCDDAHRAFYCCIALR